MRCYACIRGCGFCKAVMGAVLLGVGIWIEGTHMPVIDCNAFEEACPVAFDGLVSAITQADPLQVKTSDAAESQGYCDCFTSCMNYFTVFEKNQSSANTQNCYTYSMSAGVYSNSTNFRRLGETSLLLLRQGGFDRLGRTSRRLGDGGAALPLTGDTCASCADIQGSESKMTHWLAALACSAGLLLVLAAGCELLEVKFHSAAFSLLVVVMDTLVAAELLTAAIVAVVFLSMTLIGCNPDVLRKILEDAGKDSTDGDPDRAAIFTDFLLKLLSPLMQKFCSQFSKYMVFFLFALLGHVSALWSALASLCVCLGCSDDGDGSTHDDIKAEEMKSLMGNSRKGGGAESESD
eukprot:TRINITY_DN91688_c0_g1_i1.p1 TRINITY_DN91688_c0_g1~~TRINITY_DN91688_c0_g1_i1.p1  ORF type:complete len:349 (+),score=49.64 TRINITY_DN91688_c0_g1_i1:87-1133(+)